MKQPTRIAIFGTRGEQFKIIRSKTKHLNVKLICGNEKLGKDNFPLADIVIMTRFCTHRIWNACNDKYQIVVRVNGGTSTWIETISKLCKPLEKNKSV